MTSYPRSQPSPWSEQQGVVWRYHGEAGLHLSTCRGSCSGSLVWVFSVFHSLCIYGLSFNCGIRSTCRTPYQSQNTGCHDLAAWQCLLLGFDLCRRLHLTPFHRFFVLISVMRNTQVLSPVMIWLIISSSLLKYIGQKA